MSDKQSSNGDHALLLPEFSSRRQEMAKVESALADPAINIIAIQGIGGIGKTSLAHEIVERQHKIYSKDTQSVFINCRDNDSLPKILNEIGHQLGIDATGLSSGSLRGQVLSSLRSTNTLLVLDDYEAVAQDDEVLSFLAHLPKSAKAMILSRTPVRVSGQEISVRLEGFSEKDTLQLLTKHLGSKQVGAISPDVLHTIHNSTGGLPLAIKLVAGLIKESKSFPDVIGQLKNFEIPADKVIQQVLRRIDEGLTQRQRKLLTALSLFFQPTEGRALSFVTGIKDWRRVTDSLIRKSIIERVGERFALHPIVRAYVLTSNTDDSERIIMQKRMVEYFLSFINLNEYNFEKLNQDWSNIQHAIETAYSLNLYDQFVELLNAIRRFVEARGYEELYDSLLNRAVGIEQNIDNLQLKGELFFTLGQRLRKKGKFEEAQNAFNKSLQFNIDAKDRSGRSEVLKELGEIHEALGNIPQAKQCFTEALDGFRESINISGEISVLLSLSTLMRQESNFVEALEYANQALLFSRRLKLNVYEGYALITLGEIYTGLGNINEGKHLLQQALAIWRKIGDRMWEAINLRYLAYSARMQAQLDEAETFIKEELHIYRELGNRTSEVGALQALAMIYSDRRKYERAKELLNNARSICEQINDIKAEARVLYHLGIISENAEQYDVANEYLKQALLLSQNFKYEQLALKVFLALGRIALAEELWREAENYFQQALDISKNSGDVNQEGEIWLSLGSIYYAESKSDAYNADKAINAYEHALIIFDPKANPSKVSDINKILGEIYLNLSTGDKKQNIDKAYLYYQKALQLISKEDFPYLWAQIQFGLGVTLINLAAIENHQDTATKAINSLQSALTVFTPKETPTDWINTLAALIGLYSGMGKWPEAKRLAQDLMSHINQVVPENETIQLFLPWYEMLSDIAKHHQDFEYATQLLVEISYLYERVEGKIPENIQGKLLLLKSLIGDDQFILISAEHRGLITPRLAQALRDARQLMGEEQYLEAVSKLSNALEIINGADELPDIDRKRATVLFLKGYSLRKQGNWIESLRDQEQAFKLFEKNQDIIGAARSLLEMGYLYEIMNNYEDSRIHYMDAYRLYSKAGDKAGMASASESLGRLEYRVRLLPQAIENLREAQQIYLTLGERTKAAALETDLESAQSFLSTILAAHDEED